MGPATGDGVGRGCRPVVDLSSGVTILPWSKNFTSRNLLEKDQEDVNVSQKEKEKETVPLPYRDEHRGERTPTCAPRTETRKAE